MNIENRSINYLEFSVSSNENECKSEVSQQTEAEGCGFLRIENVVSLNPIATHMEKNMVVIVHLDGRHYIGRFTLVHLDDKYEW